MTLDLEEFHDLFFQESLEALDAMEQVLLRFDGASVAPEDINTLFRAAHSIKGGSATFGFDELTSFTHTAETLLDLVRSGRLVIGQPETDLLLRSVDVMRGMLDAASRREAPDPALHASLQAELARAIEGTNAPAPAATASPEPGIASGSPQDRWVVRLRPQPDMLGRGGDPLRILASLTALGDSSVRVDAAALPPLGEADPAVCHLGWTVELDGSVPREALDDLAAWVGDEAALEIDAPRREPESVHAADSAQPAPGAPAEEHARVAGQAGAAEGDMNRPHAEASSIRVSIEKLDELINMVGELVITQSMLSQIAAAHGGHQDEALSNGLGQLERQMRSLQESVMRVRMLPISFVFNRFPRMVRDLARKLGKSVDLRVTGEQTELDKTVLERIGDPLVHLVRNAIDHGIESPERRRAAGKTESGTIHLHAYHKGGNIIVEIDDDGAGLDRDRILAKARERGLISVEEEPSDERIHNLIFHPGFSTAETLSDVSGRGVGMDVVRRNITELGGSVQVVSRPGEGSTVRIRLPLTLAILDGQLVRVGSEIYIIPLVSIVETIQIRNERLGSMSGRAELFRLRDEFVPIVRLHELFGIEAETTDLSKGLLTVVESDGERAGILVDELLAQQQVVIKSLESNFRQLAGISGATMLGDGKVALILDVPGLVARFADEGKRSLPRPAA